MNGQLEVIRPQLEMMIPEYERLLPAVLPAARLVQTVIVALTNNTALQKCQPNSILSAAMSAAVLGVVVDGVTGQGYLVPYRQRAQFLVGYKGMVTIAARSGRTLEGFVVYEGERFEFDEAAGQVSHDRPLNRDIERPLAGAYAVSKALDMPTQVKVMGMPELLATRDRSSGWRVKGKASVWGTDFAAMCRKTPQRHLANDLPVLDLHIASALDIQHDLGRHAWVDPDRAVHAQEGTSDETVTAPDKPQPRADELVGDLWSVQWPDGLSSDPKEPAAFGRMFAQAIERCPEEALAKLHDANVEIVDRFIAEYPEHAGSIVDCFAARGIG